MKNRKLYGVFLVLLVLLCVLSVGIQQNKKNNSASKARVYITNQGYGGNGSIYRITETELIIVTTYHLLQDSDEVMIYFPNQTFFNGKVIVVNEKHDVGFVKVDMTDVDSKTMKEIDSVCYDEKAIDELEIGDTMEYRFLEWNGGNISAVTHKGKIGHTNWYIEDFEDYFIYNYCDVTPGMSGCAAVAEDGSYIGMMIGGIDNESGALSAKTIAGIYAAIQ